ncbi:MAG: DNA mismatch repair protein MutS [Ruminococcaceae bacterium]|nr:DNA mismatch repair protein MutS [Oscillospiraceae bacterium]
MMTQYFEFKAQYPDHILFFRLGDFYEMFFDDAKVASKELELTLTGRDCGEKERAPMCGVPFHSADGYIARLVARGFKVAICEQTEDPASAVGLVKRDVVRIVTPGTVFEGVLLNEKENNYLCSLCLGEKTAALCFADISTGEVSATAVKGEGIAQRLINELSLYSPRELLLNSPLSVSRDLEYYVKDRLRCLVNDSAEHRFGIEDASKLVIRYYGRLPDGENSVELTRAIGALLGYIEETQKTDITFNKKLNVYESDQYLSIDSNTRRNLEITETMRSKEKKGSLIWVLDHTKTSAGARLLRKWLEFPLVNDRQILSRQKAVTAFFEDYMLREETADLLKGVLDLERLMTKVNFGTATGKDLRAIANTLKLVPQVYEVLERCEEEEIADLCASLDLLSDVSSLIDTALVDEPPFSIREGGFIREGYHTEVDELRTIMTGGEDFKNQLEAKERLETGIKNLKIGYNRVFGYYIEVSKSNLSEVPPHYIRKQTLANGERYITQELKDLEATILGAKDKLCSLEYELFQELRSKVAAESERIQQTANALALLDVYISLADVAVKNHYVCPEVDYSDVIDIKEGRHPVVERFVSDGYFVSNDTLLDTNHNRLLLITGPNMAGKSTYMRQVAIITLMAQIGSFVPAKEARIGIVDRIFTRVGASDDLASGQSTFMLEMNEVAYILKNATRRSLIIYDEIGRGTSTFDGMSIAKAVAEYTLGKKIGAKTLFATHYHELTTLEEEQTGVVNYNIAAKKKGDDITFLRKIVRGRTDDSYGIEVANLAGIPTAVIRRAKEILAKIEAESAKPRVLEQERAEENISFDDLKKAEVIDKLKNTDVNLMTPMEALNFLFQIKKTLD